MTESIMKRLLPATSLVSLLAVWQVVAGFWSPEQFPAPSAVGLALWELVETGVLWTHITISLARFTAAYLAAVIIAVPLGLFLSLNPLCRKAIDPLIQLLRPISPVAWFPLAVLWFGIGNAPAIFIIFLSALYPIVLSTVSAVLGIPQVYFKVAANFGTRPRAVLLQVVVPAAFPGIMVGLHIAVGTAWIHLVAGEMLGAQSGLGYMIVDSRNFLRTDWIMSGMMVIGFLGLCINRLMRASERWITRRLGGE